MARATKYNLVPFLLVMLMAITEAKTPQRIAKNPSNASCKIKKYKHCYNLVYVCPNSCTVECASCKPICVGAYNPPSTLHPPTHPPSTLSPKTPTPSPKSPSLKPTTPSPKPPSPNPPIPSPKPPSPTLQHLLQNHLALNLLPYSDTTFDSNNTLSKPSKPYPINSFQPTSINSFSNSS